MTKLHKPGAFNAVLSLVNLIVPSQLILAHHWRIWHEKLQSKTSVTALTNTVSADWPHQREGVGKTKQKTSFNSFGLILTSPSHNIVLYKTHFLLSKPKTQGFVYAYCILLNCSNCLLKMSSQVFTATPDSPIPPSSARATRTEHWDPGSASDQGQSARISQVLRLITASMLSLALEELQRQMKNIFPSVSLVNETAPRMKIASRACLRYELFISDPVLSFPFVATGRTHSGTNLILTCKIWY